jgi:hypothetical protein
MGDITRRFHELTEFVETRRGAALHLTLFLSRLLSRIVECIWCSGSDSKLQKLCGTCDIKTNYNLWVESRNRHPCRAVLHSRVFSVRGLRVALHTLNRSVHDLRKLKFGILFVAYCTQGILMSLCSKYIASLACVVRTNYKFAYCITCFLRLLQFASEQYVPRMT